MPPPTPPTVDTSQLVDLSRDLRNAGRVLRAVVPITRRSGAKVKRDAQSLASGIGHAPHYPRSITYETTVLATSVRVVIGPDKDKTQGALGNILEYGTSKNAPIPHLGPAVSAEEPRYIAAVSAAAVQAVL